MFQLFLHLVDLVSVVVLVVKQTRLLVGFDILVRQLVLIAFLREIGLLTIGHHTLALKLELGWRHQIFLD